MKRSLSLAVLVVCSIIALGCAGKRFIDLNDPVWKHKQEFLGRYERLVTKREVVSYYKDVLGVVGKENEILNNLMTIEDVNKFIEVFWRVRDTDPNTPENEFKVDKDNRIEEIQSENLLRDGVIFKANGGLRGDMAHVYLFYGPPHQIEKAQNMFRVSDLMAWIYFDYSQKPRFVFLFYDKGSGYKLFKNYGGISTPEAYMERLRELAKFYPTSLDDYEEMDREIDQNDPERVFQFAIIYNQFSAYSDVVIEGGDVKKKRFGALDPPEPAALTATRFKPIILGQPGDLSGREFVNSSHNSFIPATLRMAASQNTGIYTSYILFKWGDLDWEIKGDKDAECLLLLRMSFQHKTTREIKEFLTGIRLAPNKVYLEKNNMTAKEFLEKNKNVTFPVQLSQLPNLIESSPGTLADLFKELKPGTYVVNSDLRHQITKKSAGGWREEIVVK